MLKNNHNWWDRERRIKLKELVDKLNQAYLFKSDADRAIKRIQSELECASKSQSAATAEVLKAEKDLIDFAHKEAIAVHRDAKSCLCECGYGTEGER